MAGQTETPVFDVLVIGGGVNGTAFAREASGQGLKVMLCEQDDLAGVTAAASTKLLPVVHPRHRLSALAALRSDVREREVMLQTAPHVVSPLRIAALELPRAGSDWPVRLTLRLCDLLADRRLLPRSKTLDLRDHPSGEPLRSDFGRCLVYSDCWVEEGRLAVLNARAAAENGARIGTRLRLIQARRQTGHWHATLHDAQSGSEQEVTSRVLVNTAGPWGHDVLRAAGMASAGELRLLRGIHIVVPRLYQDDRAYALHLGGERVVFALPYERVFTLIGESEREVPGGSVSICPDDAEVAELCAGAGKAFRRQITPQDVVWSYGGVRAIPVGAGSGAVDKADDLLHLDDGADRPPLLTIHDSRIAGTRRLAEAAMDRLRPYLDVPRPHWTRTTPLPGGDIAKADFEGFLAAIRQRYAWLPRPLARRYAHAYGTRLTRILGDAGSEGELGTHFGSGLYEAEVRHLVHEEWAQTAEDILWRRTKIGLHADRDMVARLRTWLRTQGLGAAAT